ncbi:MAG: PAS domain S-box protein [Deltaproteobacteria bacterium]|nr:PAS domain S-box protein [Deltaproteobacteria bacterium]
MQARLKKLIFYRLILTTIFLFMGLFFQLKGIFIFWGPYTFYHFFICLLYATTIIFALVHRKIKNLVLLTYLVIIADAVIITGIVYVTGGGLSLFFPLYILVVLEAGVILERQGGLMGASICSIFYGLLLNLEYYWVIPSLAPRYPYHSIYLLYKLFLAILSFYLAGYLTGYLAEEVRKRGKELSKTREDYSRLEAFNRYVIHSIQSGLLTTDLKGRIIFLNQAGGKILGIGISQFRYHPLIDLFPNIEEDFPGGLRSRMETTFQRPDGEEIQLGLSVSPLKDHKGKEVGKIIIFQDLTHVKKMEESMRRSEKLATIGQLAAGIAHEIRNPLASISGAIQLLKEEKEAGESTQRLMEIILAESGRLNSLITDFLLYAQPPKLNKKVVDIGALADDTLEVFYRSPQWTQGIKLVKIIEPNVTIAADPQQLQQVFWNLLINAVDAMEGKGLLEVKIQKDGRRQKVMLLVSDTGKGIPPAEINRVFDPFFTTKEGGTGLGLSIVHKIVESHEGDISVESQSDQGTTFILTFPTS